MSVRSWKCEEHGAYFARIPKCNDCQPVRQRQDSLLEQLADLAQVAEQMGCYDAADWLRRETLPHERS